MATSMFDNDTAEICLQQSPEVPNSPASIPLPDTLPPETEEEEREENFEKSSVPSQYNNHEAGGSPKSCNPGRAVKGSKKSSRKPRLIEEYDPSEPLTSSDEEEHSIQLIEGGRNDGGGSELGKSYSEIDTGGANSGSNNKVRISKTPPPPPVISSSKQAPFTLPPVSKHFSPSSLEHGSNSSSAGYNNGSGNSNNTRVDLSSTASAQSDEKRRPVIHFSIPTRHRLLPISTLIKRQKGNIRIGGRGDGGGGQGFDAVRGSDRLQDRDEDDEDCEDAPKISLVAEIFGDDEDEEEEIDGENKTDGTPQAHSAKSQGSDVLNEQEEEEGTPELLQPDLASMAATDKSQLIDANSGRWKIVANELSLPPATVETSSLPQSSEEDDKGQELSTELPAAASSSQEILVNRESAIPSQEDELEILEVITINPPPNNRLRPLRRRPYLARFGLENGGEPEVIDIDKDEDDDQVELIDEPSASAPAAPAENVELGPVPSPSRSPSPPEDEQDNIEPEVLSEPERRRRSYTPSVERDRPHFKRPHSSSSVSNCEEGEIVDQDQIAPNKKRKKDKKKKTKRRKRSRESMSPLSKSDKKSSEVGTSDKEDNGSRSAISWRKPSKRTQNRNYRDGKPKPDDTFFREREADGKQRSSSPNHKRNRGSVRKEKSPIRNKSSSKHRRDTSATRNRSLSKSPTGVASESRSKGSVEAYRGRRRNRRSRSNSSSSDRSLSRRRSARRRYRRSTSRHHQGGSKSPSYITELIRSRASNFPKLSDRSRSRSRDQHNRSRHRKGSLSRSHSPILTGHRANRKPESSDRMQKRKQLKEKEKQLIEETLSENKEKRRERAKEKEKRKKKEKSLEENKKEQKEKEKVKEKEKKKKKKRREKSPTPVKAIVADGDSIVVSLSFSKGKTAVSTTNAQSRASTEDQSKDYHNGLQESESTESNNNPHQNINGNDIERSHHNDDNHHPHDSSPVKSVDDDNDNVAVDANHTSESSKGKKADDKEAETIKVTSSGGGSCGSRSPFETENACSAVADSTKGINSQQVEQYESSFSHSRRSSMSPTDVESNLQGDSLVTSTGDTIDIPPLLDDDSSKLNSCSTPSKQSDSSKIFSNLSHKPSANMSSPRGGQTSTSTSTSESSTTPSATTSHASSSAGGSSQNFASTSTPHTRPLIGNIPGLYPSSAINSSGGAAPVPPPIVIPTPPPPQGIRFSAGNSSAPMLNPNVLASVASALLAVRQNQPAVSGKLSHASAASGSSSDNKNMQLRHMNVLGPKSQNFTIQSNLRNSTGGNYSEEQGGDSPMSPNSSEGDDLFEPPTDRPQTDKGANGGNKGGKNGQLFGNATMLPANNPIDNFNAAGHANKERSLFETLFESGTDIKKQTGGKPEKSSKNKQKLNRKGGPKKETIKVNTSGGLAKGELRLTDEVPTSAVELIVKQKYLKKLNRQERVVEEVKLSLKPHYSKRHINKDEYKEILRRAVPKICHNKTGEINPGKIKELVEAYVKKIRHARKRGLDISSIK